MNIISVVKMIIDEEINKTKKAIKFYKARLNNSSNLAGDLWALIENINRLKHLHKTQEKDNNNIRKEVSIKAT